MDDRDDLVQKVGYIGLEDICIVDELLDLNNHEYSRDFLPRLHNLQITLPRRHLPSDYNSTQLSERHLEQVANPENGLLKLYCLHLFLLDAFVFLELRGLGLVEGVLGQCLND